MHKTMASVVSLGKIEIIRSQRVYAERSEAKIFEKMIILGPKTAILGPQFCRILVLGPHFWWSGGAQAPRVPPGSAPELMTFQHGCPHHWIPPSRMYFLNISKTVIMLPLLGSAQCNCINLAIISKESSIL